MLVVRDWARVGCGKSAGPFRGGHKGAVHSLFFLLLPAVLAQKKRKPGLLTPAPNVFLVKERKETHTIDLRRSAPARPRTPVHSNSKVDASGAAEVVIERLLPALKSL